MFSKYVNVDGVAVNYFHTGASTLPDVRPALDQGELLLFLHGAGSNAHTWHRQLAHIEGQHSGIALDLPGHGRSGSTEGLADLDRVLSSERPQAASPPEEQGRPEQSDFVEGQRTATPLVRVLGEDLQRVTAVHHRPLDGARQSTGN